jgi:hypothetical protein
MINNNMLYGLGDLMIGTAGVTIPSYMTMGSVSDTLTSGDLVTSGEFKRIAITTKSRSSNIDKFQTLFTGTLASSLYINSVGLFNSSAGGALWANMLMSSILQTTSFDIDVEFWVQLSRL